MANSAGLSVAAMNAGARLAGVFRLPAPIGFACLLALVLASAGGCEDSPRERPTPAPSVAPSLTPSSTRDPGPEPSLAGHVTQLVPPHGTSISQAATRTLDPQRPQPPCFAADFTDLPEEGLWFRMLLDGAEATTQFTWIAPFPADSGRPPRACYATEAGLAPGDHTIVIVVRPPFDDSAPAVETVTWSFAVSP